MAARVLDGTAVAAHIRAEAAPTVAEFTARAGRPPALAIVLVGDDPASAIYVRSKLKSAGDVGLRTEHEHLPAGATLDQLLQIIDRLNRADDVDGILVQSPLPAAMGADAERRVFDAIDPRKDVDCFHPTNVGLLVQNRATLAACTPSGVIELLERSGVRIAGARAVVIGRSDIVGKPMALLLLHRHATVTICHSKTIDLPSVASEADILVAALGRPAFVTADFVKRGAAVVDIGTTQVSDRATIERLFPPGSRRHAAFEKRGSLVVGDVHPEVANIAGALSPVPGGVGPLTIAMLLKNTVTAAIARAGGVWPDLLRPIRPTRPSAMLRVALTGGIATGKSYVLDRLSARGVACLDADALVHGIEAPGTEATAAIAERFGVEVLAADGSVNRAKLGRIVFADPAARKDLEAIVHPAVYRAIQAGLRGFELVGCPLAVVGVPLLYESGGEKSFDKVIVTACSPETQLARLVERGLSEETARQRLAAQWPTEKKTARADFVITTDGTFADTDSQIDQVVRLLSSKS